MTIGIAINLRNAVLLVADGKETDALNPQSEPKYDTVKIHQILDEIAAINFGIVPAAYMSSVVLRQSLLENLSDEAIKQALEDSLAEGWRYFRGMYGSQVNLKSSKMRTALIIGGFLGDSPFISSKLISETENAPVSFETEPYKYSLLGGDEQNAEVLFGKRLGLSAYKYEVSHEIDSEDDLIRSFLKDSVDIIREVEQLNDSVGGVIRYVVMRKGQPVEVRVH